MNYSNIKKNSRVKNTLLGIVIVLVVLVIATTVIGIGSKGFEDWNTKNWFKEKPLDYNLDVSNVDDLVGVKFNQVEDWSVAIVADIENEAYYDLPCDKDVEKGIYIYSKVLSVPGYGNEFKFENGIYDVVVEINGEIYEVKNLTVMNDNEDDNDCNSFTIVLDEDDYTVEKKLLDSIFGDTKGYAFNISDKHVMYAFDEESGSEPIALEGAGLQLMSSNGEIETFEIISFEKVDDIPEVEAE